MSSPAPADPGLLPYLQLLWPDLSGRRLVSAAAEAFGVHTTTVYIWLRQGMGRVASEDLLRVHGVITERLGAQPPLPGLLLPSANPTADL